MKLTGELKKQVEKAGSRKAARETIAEAGMLLNDEELDQVAGGFPGSGDRCPQNNNGEHNWVTINGFTFCSLCRYSHVGRVDAQGIT